MTQPQHTDGGDAGRNAAQPSDNAAVSQKLFSDLQGKFFTGSNKPETVDQLVKDGILPAGSTVIDFSTVQGHLKDDQKKLTEVQGQQPTDTTPATKALADATAVQTTTGAALDQANAKAKPIEDRMQARTAEEAQVSKDYATVSGALKNDTVYKKDLTDLVANANTPVDVKAAAQNLLSTFHTAGHTGPRGQRPGEKSDYAETGGWSGKHYFDKDTLQDAAAKHASENAADQKALEPLAAARDQAKQAKEQADAGVTTAQKGLDTVNGQNKALTDQQTQLEAKVKEEQEVLTPDASADKAGRVVKGGGYYQVAENLLGISDKGHHTAMQEKELRMLTHLLQDEEKQLNGGHLPKYLKQNDQLLRPENLQDVLKKLRPAPVEAPATAPPAPEAPPAPPPGQGQ